MTGGVAYVLDLEDEFLDRYNPQLITPSRLEVEEDISAPQGPYLQASRAHRRAISPGKCSLTGRVCREVLEGQPHRANRETGCRPDRKGRDRASNQ